MTLYDVYIENPVRNQNAENQNLNEFNSRGWYNTELSLSPARQLVSELRHNGANAYVVPSQYRLPIISFEEAITIAAKKYAELINSGKRLGELNNGYDDFLWWTFYVDDIEAIEKDMIPGMITVSVDKLDGHIRSNQEFEDWQKLSSF